MTYNLHVDQASEAYWRHCIACTVKQCAALLMYRHTKISIYTYIYIIYIYICGTRYKPILVGTDWCVFL